MNLKYKMFLSEQRDEDVRQRITNNIVWFLINWISQVLHVFHESLAPHPTPSPSPSPASRNISYYILILHRLRHAFVLRRNHKYHNLIKIRANMLAVHFASRPVSHASSHSNNNDYDMHGAIASSVPVTFVHSSVCRLWKCRSMISIATNGRWCSV